MRLQGVVSLHRKRVVRFDRKRVVRFDRKEVVSLSGFSKQESSLKKICEEILALTKLNFNNCNYYDSLPITIRFAQKVGEITQYIEPGTKPPDRYFYYM